MRNLWVHMTGPDRPGLLARVMAGVVDMGLQLTDVEQVAVGDRLILALAVQRPQNVTPTYEGLAELALDLGLTVELRDERRPVLSDGGTDLVITVLGEPVSAAALGAVGSALANRGANIRRIETLARRRLHCIEMLATVPGGTERQPIATELLAVSARFGVDVSVQEEGIERRSKRMVVMDVDSTLIQAEVIDELARVAGVGDYVAKITERAMNGELDFKGALKERVGLLKGLPVAKLEEVYRGIQYSPGTRSLVNMVKKLGYKIAILSGGFTYFTDRFKSELGLDYAFANVLEIEGGALTGRTVGDIVDGQRKAELVRQIAQSEMIRLDQVIVIGDGANDLPMMGIAGLGIAFNAKPRVREMAPYAINRKGLDSILFLLGIREEDIERVEAAGLR